MSKNPKFIPPSEQSRSSTFGRGRKKHIDLSPEELAELKRDQARHYRKHGTGNILTATAGPKKLGNHKVLKRGEYPGQYTIANKPKKQKPKKTKRGIIRYKKFD